MPWRWFLLLGVIAVGCTCGGPQPGHGDGGDSDARQDARSDGGLDASVDGGGDAGEGGLACGAAGMCPMGQFCFMAQCVPDRGPCATNDDCRNDTFCATGALRCTPYTPGANNPMCARSIAAGVFAPAVQCSFADAPAGDAYPLHLHVLSTPMVADLVVYRGAPDDPIRPSIIAVFDDGIDGSSEEPTGLIRVLDGRTCALQDNLAEQMVSHSSPPAIADLDGDGTPEIVAFKAGGGLVAFRYTRAGTGDASAVGGWHVWWRSTNTDGVTAFDPAGGGWAGPTVVDIDDDGRPEVLRHGMVFNGQTGALIGGTSARAQLQGYSAGAFSVVLDVDEDGAPELVTGAGVYAWSPATHEWAAEPYYMRAGCAVAGCADGHAAVADLGAYTNGTITDPGLPEIAIVSAGYVRIDTIDGRTVFGPIAIPGGGTGGAPTVADFDGDGLREIAAAGASRYAVFDPDCTATPRPGGRCGTGTVDGVLWAQPSQDASSNVTGSTSFDFEADGRVEAVYADECFARVYNGATGEVLFSQHHSSCTWYENPVVADVDGDFRAEIVVGSNFNCGSPTTGIACPGVGARNTDALHAGIRCLSGADCPSSACDAGFCRCTTDTQCCPPTGECTYVCTDPPAGTPGTGMTCRASRPVGVRGIRVYNDVADRWVRSRMVWNQHAYNVTNVGDDARIPRTSAVAHNWRDPTLNNFRTNVQGGADLTSTPDATTSPGRIDCLIDGARITVHVCNRGTSPLPDGSFVGIYDGDPGMGGTQICRTFTPRPLSPGECADVYCMWASPPSLTPATLYIRADDEGTTRECFEGNNLGTIQDVICRPPG